MLYAIHSNIAVSRHVQKTRLPRKKEVSPKSLRKSRETTNEKVVQLWLFFNIRTLFFLPGSLQQNSVIAILLDL